MRSTALSAASVVAALSFGCHSQYQPPVNMAPPISQGQQMGMGQANPYQSMNGGGAPQAQQSAGVYQWQDVPQNQQVPITRATFDSGGYQIFANTGETIVVPFANQNLYVLKFGQASGQPYFVNQGDAPVLYLPPGGYLENAAAQNARWYPIPANYNYSAPMYVSMAPSWNDYAAMGWYPGMNYYGGMWGYHPYSSFAWMPGFYVSIGGSRYTTFTSYHSYYVSNPSYVRTTTIYHNYSAPRATGFGTRSFAGGGGSFGSHPSASSGSFGNRSAARPFGGASTGGGFGSSRPMGGSFGGNRGSSFGSRTGGGSFSSRPSGGGFSSRPSGGSFGRRR